MAKIISILMHPLTSFSFRKAFRRLLIHWGKRSPWGVLVRGTLPGKIPPGEDLLEDKSSTRRIVRGKFFKWGNMQKGFLLGGGKIQGRTLLGRGESQGVFFFSKQWGNVWRDTALRESSQYPLPPSPTHTYIYGFQI